MVAFLCQEKLLFKVPGFSFLSGLKKTMQEAINYLSSKDQTLKYILENFGHPIIQKREEGFASMCHIILEQQVSIASAKACFLKIENYFKSITPEILLKATDEELRNCGVSRQKSSYLKDLASKVISNEIDFATFTSKSEAQIRKELITIKGVGNWSIEVYLMFCLQAPDIIPLGDIAIVNTMKELYQINDKSELQNFTNSWSPHRTFASFLLWHYYLLKKRAIKKQD